MKLRDTLAFCLFLFMLFGLLYLGSMFLAPTTSSDFSAALSQSKSGTSASQGDGFSLPEQGKRRQNVRHGKTKMGWKPGSLHVMVDLEELHVKHEGDRSPSVHGSHTILYYDHKLATDHDNAVVKTDCVYSNCQFTTDMSVTKKASALIFQASRDPDLKPPSRSREQVWIVSDTELEPPGTYAFQGLEWRNAINWTISYRQDADVLWTPGTLRSRRPEAANTVDLSVTEKSKVEQVMTYVSNCSRFESSGMKDFVLEFRKYSRLGLDIYGECNDTQPLSEDLKKTASRYRLFIVLEDFLCPEYVAKEIYDYYHFETVLVVKGKEYESLFPKAVFFNAAKFDNIQAMAEALDVFVQDQQAYADYVINKKSYVIGPGVRWQCDLCEKLNNQASNTQVYESVSHALNRTECLQRDNARMQHGTAPVLMKLIIVSAIAAVFLYHFWKYCCRFYCRADDGGCRITYFDHIDWSRVPLISTAASDENTLTTPR